MPSDRLRHLAHLVERFLHAILADVANPRGPRGCYCLRPVSFRDCDNGDLLPMPSPLRRGIDSLSDGRDSSAQLRKKHSWEI
jgi:hypothetical protein